MMEKSKLTIDLSNIEALFDKFLEFLKDDIGIQNLVKICALNEEQPEPEEWPKYGDTFYTIGETGAIYESQNDEFEYDLDSYVAFGNIFKTKEEAVFVIEQLKVIHELKELGARKFKKYEQNYFLVINLTGQEDVIYVERMFSNHRVLPCLYFSDANLASEAIDKIGEERLKNIILGLGKHDG